jgi:peptidoglycan L-alanyl-D-glutamate endopeptidase CwlK
MIRNPEGLIPSVRAKVEQWHAACLARGVEMLVYCTRRTALEQEALYAKGRTAPGPKVTNAGPWQSWHQYGRAIDAVPLDAGKPVWKYSPANGLWAVAAEEGAKAGLEWAGRWRTFREYVHWQDTGGMSLTEAYNELHPVVPTTGVA